MKIIFIIVSLNIILSSSIFEDKKTNLIWQSNPSPLKYTFLKAKEYCDLLEYANKNDWKLPNIDEMMSLTDKSNYLPAIITNKVIVKIDDWYWTKSHYIVDMSRIWVVNFDSGRDAFWHNQNNKNYVLCVRKEY
jgi:hypothetical protein